MDADNGATRGVPGSHRFTQRAREALADPSAPHPEEVRLIAPACTVVVFNRPQTLARLGPAARFILDIEEPP